MNYFILKSDPSDYSLQDLAKNKTTIWDGVHNYQAINFIKTMKIGDMLFIYHSQKEKAIMGLATVVGDPFLNSTDPRYSWAMEIEFCQYLKPLTLASIKDSPLCQDLLLVKNPRLSVIPVSTKALGFILQEVGL
jgi:predicted RNA-binding protein with PUA-like domain